MKLTALALLTGALMAFGVNAADAPKQLNLGILGGQNATQQIGDNQCVKTFFDKELGVDTQLRNSSDYAGVIQGLLGNKIDMVLSMSPASYASVYLQNPKAVDIVGMADPGSTSGFLMPNQAFKKEFGGTVDDKYNNTFSSVTFSGGHEQDILGVLNGQFDGAVTWTSLIGDYNSGYTSGAFGRLIRMDHPDLMKQIRIIWQSPLIPNGPILVSNNLPADFKAKVVAAIKKLDKEDHSCFVKAVGGAQHIGAASVADYQNIIDMKRDLMKGARG